MSETNYKAKSLFELAIAGNRMRATPIVDDDFPEMIHDFDSKLHHCLKLMNSCPEEAFFNFYDHLIRQRIFSEKTFGPGSRATMVIDHIKKELQEITENPSSLEEWIDVVLLALDGAWRTGASEREIVAALTNKQTINENRSWPDWRKHPIDQALEHNRN